MKMRLLAVAVSFLPCAGISAAPTVSGNTISWPDDGYYQVQDASDYRTICEATANCEVDDGEYTVINHTTGQRFEGVMVPSSPATAPQDGFEVEGNTIRFSEDAWFQVQDSTTYASLCNGASECVLEDGSYIVINHTSGLRLENVMVGGPQEPDTPVDPGTRPTVSGNLISWADDGWYQVQTSEDYQSICQGGRSCEVAAGRYRVINLTTGTRYDNVVVTEGGPSPVTPPVDPGEVPAGTYPAQLSVSDSNARLSDFPVEVQLPSDARLIGDINGDGLEDALVILPGEQAFNTTAAIVFADAVGSYPDLPLDTSLDAGLELTLSNGFLIQDVLYAGKAGDVNDDGFDDLIVRGSGFFTLARTVVLAGASSFPARQFPDSLPDDQILVKLPNIGSLTSAGDINGDGINDLLITGPSEASGGILYGSPTLKEIVDELSELSDIALLQGCGPTYSCSMRAIGDFDNDGFDDLYISRLGAGICGFGSFTAVIYGRAEGIEKLQNYTDYSTDEATRIVGANAGNCYPKAVARPYDFGDVDGDGATDLILGTAYPDEKRYLIFGMSDRRRSHVSIDELDGQRGITIPGDLNLSLSDINGDGFDDILFPDDTAYTGFSRDMTSIDAPVVRRTPSEFIVYLPDTESALDTRYQISINGVDAGTFDSTLQDAVVDDLTEGAEALLEMTLVSSEDEVLSTRRRLVPAYPGNENLTASLIAPRLVELSFDSNAALRAYGNYVVWRNDVPIGRPTGGALTYIDNEVELGQTYSYFLTPDYLVDGSLDATQTREFPLLQHQSSRVTVTTPDF